MSFGYFVNDTHHHYKDYDFYKKGVHHMKVYLYQKKYSYYLDLLSLFALRSVVSQVCARISVMSSLTNVEVSFGYWTLSWLGRRCSLQNPGMAFINTI